MMEGLNESQIRLSKRCYSRMKRRLCEAAFIQNLKPQICVSQMTRLPQTVYGISVLRQKKTTRKIFTYFSTPAALHSLVMVESLMRGNSPSIQKLRKPVSIMRKFGGFTANQAVAVAAQTELSPKQSVNSGFV